MEYVMRWDIPSERNEFTSEAEAVRQFREPICEIVREESARREGRRRGIKKALSMAADIVDLPYQRVRAAWYDEVRAPLAHEMTRVRRGYRRWLFDQRMKLAVANERLERKIQELERDE